jgi:hypothetical protein
LLFFYTVKIAWLLADDAIGNMSKIGMKSFSTGSKIALNEIFTLLKKFYPTEFDYETALNNLEFIGILFNQICNLSYSEGIQK